MNRRKRVVIVSPYFPPSNLAGAHRARLLSANLSTHSWDPVVVCVHERHHGQTLDEQLCKLVPESVRVLKTGAIPAAATQLFGVRDIGIRAYWHLEKTVSALLSNGDVDLLYITASPYYNALSGPQLKKTFGVPFVMDFQDPWVSQWGTTRPPISKGGISHRLATWLEPRVMRHADHVTSVSDVANDQMRARYPAMPADAFSAMPIGGDAADFEFLRKHPIATEELKLREGEFHFSYTGTIWPRGVPALRALLVALDLMKRHHRDLYRRVRLNFIGTSGQPDERSSFGVMKQAVEIGVSDRITEIPQRVSYLQALNTLSNSDAVLVIGSDEPHYSASKLYTSLHAGHPFLAVLHEQNNACDMLRRSGGGKLITFTKDDDECGIATQVLQAMLMIVRDPNELQQLVPRELAPHSAEFVVRRYADLFDRVVANGCQPPWW